MSLQIYNSEFKAAEVKKHKEDKTQIYGTVFLLCSFILCIGTKSNRDFLKGAQCHKVKRHKVKVYMTISWVNFDFYKVSSLNALFSFLFGYYHKLDHKKLLEE